MNVIGEQLTAEDEIEAFKSHVINYRHTLSQEGIWLFLATLGCWGVSIPIFKLFAFFITLIIFYQSLKQKIKDKRSLFKLKDVVVERICKLIPENDTRKARLYDLEIYFINEVSSSWRIFFEGLPFILSFTFFFASGLSWILIKP